MARRVLGVMLLAGLGALSGARPAFADGTADEADLHFRLGKEEYKKGAFDAALTHFFLSNRLVSNRNVLFNIAGAYEALGRYADAHRYYVDARSGESDEKKRADAQAAIDRLAPNVAVLEVATEPPGATLYIERKDLGSVGRSPRPLAVAPGKYRVIAELAGHETRTLEDVTVELGKRVQVALTLPRIVGTVHVDVRGGPSAIVRVDSDMAAPACTAPCDLTLPPGRHDLHFSAEGYDVGPRPVTVEANRTVVALASLVPQVGSLVVRTEDRDATVSVDGKPIGFTPLVARDIQIGRRAIRIELPGYQPFTTTVDVRVGKEAEIADLVLTPLREVSAVSRTNESVDDAPASVSIIDRREISAMGYPTLYEALRGIRGFAMSNDRVYPTAQVRGLGQPGDYGNRFLVLSDGQSLNENVLATSFIAQDGRADLGDVERIEIVRGPGSLLYGSSAMSGLVNLVMRPPDGPNEVGAGAGVYDNNVLHGRASFHRNFGPGRSVWASASASHSEGFDEVLPTIEGPSRARGIEAFSAGGTTGRVTIGALTGQWLYHRRRQQLPIGPYAGNFDDARTVVADERIMGEIRYEPRIDERLQILTRAHGNYYGSPLRVAYADGVQIDRYEGAWFGGEARAVYSPLPWLHLTAGGELQHHPLASVAARYAFDAGGEEPIFDKNRPYTIGAGYALAEGSPTSWLRFSAGVRVDLFSNLDPFVVPRASVILKPAEGHNLKIMGGRAFRRPSVFEQHYDLGGIADPESGFPLTPESSWSGEIEYSWRFLRDWVAVAAAHTTAIDGLIEASPLSPGSFVTVYRNGDGSVLVGGGELELRREWRRGLMLSASYGYQRAQKLGSAAGDGQLTNVPEHLASARFVVPVFKDLASLGFRATLEAPRQLGDGTGATTDAAVVADATVSGLVSEIGVRYVLGVYNFMDWRYQVPVEATFIAPVMPQNGRRFLLNLEWAWR